MNYVFNLLIYRAKRVCYFLFFFVLFVYCYSVQSETISAEINTGELELIITHLPPASTGLIISIYRLEKTFLKQADEVYYFPLTALNDNKLRLENIAYGDFVIAVAADQNANQLLDTKIFGIPSEPVGFAGNAKTRFGPPRFNDNLITFSTTNSSFAIKLVDI